MLSKLFRSRRASHNMLARASKRPRRRSPFRLEQLEPRVVLSGTNWADTFGSAGTDWPTDMDVGPDSSSYLVGRFPNGENIDFDDDSSDGQLTSSYKAHPLGGDGESFITKYNSDGNFEWAVHASNEDKAWLQGVTVDSQDNTYVAGTFFEFLELYGDGVLEASVSETVRHANDDIFLAKISAQGHIEWIAALGGKNRQRAQGIEAFEDPSTGALELYVSGDTWGGGDLDPGPGDTLESAGDLDRHSFIAQYDVTANGLSLGWLHTRPAESLALPEDIDATEDRVVEVGRIDSDGFVAAYTRDGSLLWQHQGLVDVSPRGVTVVNDGTYVSGHFTGAPDLDSDGAPDVENPTSMSQGFVAKYSLSGELLWAQRLSGSGGNYLMDVTVSPAGIVHAAGDYRGSLTFGGDLPDLTVHGGDASTSDGLVVDLDSESGNFLAAHRFGGSADEWGDLVHVDATGTIRVAGATWSTDATFPNVSETFATEGGRDGFIAAFTPASAPVAADDTAGTAVDTPVTIAVLANDSDPNGDPLTVTNLTLPSSGSVVLNADNTVTYTPEGGFIGIDSFTYTASDGTEESSVATVAVMVEANDPPTAVDDSATTTSGTAVTIDVLSNDSDPDGDPLQVVSVDDPANGKAVVNADQTVTYSPPAEFVGTESFNYTIEDGRGGSSTALITVTVEAPATLHVANLDGTATSLRGGHWKADVTITVVDSANNPVPNATVNGTWSGGYSGTASGTTDSSGTLTVSTDRIHKNSSSVVFTIDGVSHPDYEPGSNTYTSIQVNKDGTTTLTASSAASQPAAVNASSVESTLVDSGSQADARLALARNIARALHRDHAATASAYQKHRLSSADAAFENLGRNDSDMRTRLAALKSQRTPAGTSAQDDMTTDQLRTMRGNQHTSRFHVHDRFFEELVSDAEEFGFIA